MRLAHRFVADRARPAKDSVLIHSNRCSILDPDGGTFPGRDGGPGDPSIALGSGRAPRRRGGDGRPRDGDAGAGRRDRSRRRSRRSARCSARCSGPGRGLLDRLFGAGRDPGARRAAPRDGPVAPGRPLERADHARPSARRGGPGGRCHRRLAGPRGRLRPGRGRGPRHPARVARGPHPRRRGGGARDRRRAPVRADRGSPRRGPAAPAGESGAVRRSPRSPRRPRPPGRDQPPRPRAAGADPLGGRRSRRGDGGPPRARPAGLDPPRAGRRRPVRRGRRRPQPRRPARPAGHPPDPVCRWRRARRLPPPGRAPQPRRAASGRGRSSHRRAPRAR